jgi:Spy/CpxP family protein refolding chaperone
MNLRGWLIVPLLAACASTDSPYVGQETRGIKALSSDEVSGLLAGKGMGLAKSAELNGYPGPLHVLELARELKLSDEQKSRTDAVFAAMQANAKALGQALVDEERQLDTLFAGKTATDEAVAAALRRIGELQAQLRTAHLQAHLAQARILTAEQVERYNELRGYGKPGTDPGVHKH